jgi:hypothetical protein
MQAYTMRRYTLTAPLTTNDGSAALDARGFPSNHPQIVRDALLDAGIDGWTEYQTVGWWKGKREEGVTFELYRACADMGPLALRDNSRDGHTFARQLARIGRRCMPDQEAVQVTVEPVPVTLFEG